MSQQVWKFPVRAGREFAVDMPEGAKVLSFAVQHGTPQIWALVDPAETVLPRSFRLYGTGHNIHDGELDGYEFVGTFLAEGGALVFHLWARE